MSKDELKPCPFCGNTDFSYIGNSNDLAVWCRDCDCRIPLSSWNTRTNSELDTLRKEMDEAVELVRMCNYFIFSPATVIARDTMNKRVLEFLSKHKEQS